MCTYFTLKSLVYVIKIVERKLYKPFIPDRKNGTSIYYTYGMN